MCQFVEAERLPNTHTYNRTRIFACLCPRKILSEDLPQLTEKIVQILLALTFNVVQNFIEKINSRYCKYVTYLPRSKSKVPYGRVP